MKVEHIYERASAYGVPGYFIEDGNDVLAVYETFRKAVDDVRAGKGPVLIESVTYRWFGHSSSDPGKYRTKEEVDSWKAKDPNIKFRNRLIEEGIATEEELTVKQLMRIELGRSLPTIVKLQYISDKLGVSLNYLLGETKLDIPEDYYQAKYKLMKSPVYGDLERIKKKLKDIEELYDNYIDILPEEELLTIDIIERTLNFMVMEEDSLIESVFED